MFLNYFIKFKSLYIEVNILKKKEFTIIIYYVKKNFKFLNEFLVFTLIKLILFLNKLLMLIEIKY